MQYFGQDHWVRGWCTYNTSVVGLGGSVVWQRTYRLGKTLCPWAFTVHAKLGPWWMGIRIQRPLNRTLEKDTT